MKIKTNHWKGERLLMDLLTNKAFPKLTLSKSLNKTFLNKGLEWELHDWKLIILRAFFVKWQGH